MRWLSAWQRRSRSCRQAGRRAAAPAPPGG